MPAEVSTFTKPTWTSISGRCRKLDSVCQAYLRVVFYLLKDAAGVSRETWHFLTILPEFYKGCYLQKKQHTQYQTLRY